ncbi:MAG TPA: YihY/virulence factor BrkB family protein [Actinomycetota bacterium]|jgi:YihY family inner membrane protein|nr:YihY/virulence factor BrkB family protein [Actinomycetota bacterium]
MPTLMEDLTTTLPAAPVRSAGTFTKDVVRHFRRADGTSHTRGLAYQVMLVVIPGLIALVGLASMLHIAEVRSTVQHLVEMLSPGPSGKLLTEAAAQGASGGATAAIVGLVAALIAGMFAVAQVERSANRLSGLDQDRPTAKRYGLALLLAIPVGILLSAGVVLIGAGGPVVDGLGLEGGARVVWEVARWPLGLLVAAAGIMLLLRVAPVRRLGSTRHLMAGTAIAVVLWGVFTGLLSLYFALSNSTSQTYGPLLAVIALLLWAGATSLALHLGITACVELER